MRETGLLNSMAGRREPRFVPAAPWQAHAAIGVRLPRCFCLDPSSPASLVARANGRKRFACRQRDFAFIGSRGRTRRPIEIAVEPVRALCRARFAGLPASLRGTTHKSTFLRKRLSGSRHHDGPFGLLVAVEVVYASRAKPLRRDAQGTRTTSCSEATLCFNGPAANRLRVRSQVNVEKHRLAFP